jgi:hypothetical protein
MLRFTKNSVHAAAGFAAALCAALLALPLSGCVPSAAEEESAAARAPVIAYSEPVIDTLADSVGAPRVYRFRLDPVSSGGPIGHYRMVPAPTTPVTFDTATGRVSYTLDDGFWNDWDDYLVIAVGPGGADTLEIRIPVNRITEPVVTLLVVNIGLKSTNSSALAKSSALTLSKLVITLTSSSAADPVLRDTISASEAGGSQLSPEASQDQAIRKSYHIKPLRSWTVAVKSLDVNSTVIHQGTAVAANVLVGETRDMTLNLVSRFQPHAAKFTFPDSVATGTTSTKRKLSVGRIVMTINGDTVRDTTGAFASSSVHHLGWEYVPADTAHVVGFYVYADSLSWWPSTLPVAGGTFVRGADTLMINTVQIPWTGPIEGPTLTVQYGPTNQVVVEPPIGPNPLPRRAAGQ